MMRAFAILMLSWATTTMAADMSDLKGSSYVSVVANEWVNMRGEPSTEGPVVGRVDAQQILRLAECVVVTFDETEREDEHWCEVEPLVGGLEGWVSSEFLKSHEGVDPFALTNVTAGQGTRLRVDPSKAPFEGRMEKGGLVDLLMDMPLDQKFMFTLSAPDNLAMSLFNHEGRLLGSVGPNEILEAILLDEPTILVRVADKKGGEANWRVELSFEAKP